MAEMTLADGIDLLERRTKVVRALLIVGFATGVAVMIGQIGELRGDLAIDNPDPSSQELLYLAVLLANSVITIITIVIFSMWIYRAAANVVAAGRSDFKFTPGWCVGWYFVPFANLVQPFLAMRQIWNASHGGGSDLDRGDPILTLWWTAWLTSNIAANLSVQINWRATTTEMFELSLQLGIASSVLGLVLMVVGIRLVEFTSAAQRNHLSPSRIFA